jgi:hypothetical protein
MGIISADAILKTAIELFLDDLRANEWLIDDIFSDLVTNSYLNQKYGKKQVQAAKEWFKNNKINISLAYVSDRMEFPHIAIVLGGQNEKTEMKLLGDASTDTVKLLPKQIKKPIPYIIKPFSPISYNQSTGTVTLDPNVLGDTLIAAGMILVNPATGQGWAIQDATDNTIILEPGIEINATQLAVVPANQFYVARVEHSFSQASYNIICSCHGDPQSTIWLHDIVLYGLYRYRESLLEANGMAETTFQSGPLKPSEELTNDGGDLVFDRTISISAQVEMTWIKSPQRLVETVALREKRGSGYIGGVSILSNLDADSFEDAWYTDTIATAKADFNED